MLWRIAYVSIFMCALRHDATFLVFRIFLSSIACNSHASLHRSICPPFFHQLISKPGYFNCICRLFTTRYLPLQALYLVAVCSTAFESSVVSLRNITTRPLLRVVNRLCGLFYSPTILSFNNNNNPSVISSEVFTSAATQKPIRTRTSLKSVSVADDLTTANEHEIKVLSFRSTLNIITHH